MMNPTEHWIDAWLNNKAMPPHALPATLLPPLLDTAERWLESDHGPRKQLEEFVAREESYDVMDGLLYSGFCHDRSRPQRTPPIPVIVQLLYRSPPPADREALEAAMVEVFARVLSEWCRLYLGGQGPLYTAP
jgi:hypothetical protein